MSELALTTPKETAKAAQAFADYVNLGPDRSLRKLAHHYRESGSGPTSNLRQLMEWSAQHDWQERVKALAAEQIVIGQELKTNTWFTILGEYHRRVSNEPMRRVMELNGLHGIYDRVKPEIPSNNQPTGGNVLIQFVFNEAMRRD